MKTKEINLARLHNEEHYQFQTDFKKLVERYNPATLTIEAAFDAYLDEYSNESEALDVIRKSAITDDIEKADALRDFTFRGLIDAVKSAVRHFNPDVHQAAVRVQVVMDHFGNVARKPFDEETAAINSMVTDLTATNADDVATIGIADWVTELKSKNDAFDTLKQNRYTEESGKTMLRMKQTRMEVDAAYHTITARIDALIIVNGEAVYSAFVNELNQRVDSYSNLLAQRRGRNAKNAAEPGAPVA